MRLRFHRHPGNAPARYPGSQNALRPFAIPCLRSVISCRGAHGTTRLRPAFATIPPPSDLPRAAKHCALRRDLPNLCSTASGAHGRHFHLLFQEACAAHRGPRPRPGGRGLHHVVGYRPSAGRCVFPGNDPRRDRGGESRDRDLGRAFDHVALGLFRSERRRQARQASASSRRGARPAKGAHAVQLRQHPACHRSRQDFRRAGAARDRAFERATSSKTPQIPGLRKSPAFARRSRAPPTAMRF